MVTVKSPVSGTLYEVNRDEFNPVTFYPAKSVDTLYVSLKASNYYQAVKSDYSFTLQNTKQVPAKGVIVMEFPSDWATILSPT